MEGGMGKKFLVTFTIIAFMAFSYSCYSTKAIKVETEKNLDGKELKVVKLQKKSEEYFEFPKKQLTWTSEGDSIIPAITIDSINRIHIVWQKNLDTMDDYWGEIFYQRSTDGGANWTAYRLTYKSEWSCAPSAAVDLSDNIHVVWHDHTPGNYEIYYKKGIQ